MRTFVVMVQRGKCDQLVDTLLIGKVSRSQHHQPSGSSGVGSMCMLRQHAINFFQLMGLSGCAK